MKIEKIDASTFQVNEATIRNFDWQLIRKPGQGTYAVVAGPTDDADDETFVIEEYDDPERRELWDNLTVMGAASAARRQVLEDIGEGFTANAADIAADCGKTANWVRVLGPELEREGLAQKAGTSWLFSPAASEYIRNRPDRRGAPSMIDKIIRACVEAANGPDGQYTGASVSGDFGEGPFTYEWRGRLGEYAPKWKIDDSDRLLRWPHGHMNDPRNRPQDMNWETGEWEYRD